MKNLNRVDELGNFLNSGGQCPLIYKCEELSDKNSHFINGY